MLKFFSQYRLKPSVFKYPLLFILFITRCTDYRESNEIPEKLHAADPKGLNSIITNELSTFDGNKFIEKEAKEFLQQWNMAGMSMAIVKDGRLVFAHGFGYSDLSNKVPVTPGNLFRVASVSKLITTVAIMKLVEDKVFSLESKVFGPKGIVKDSVFNKVKDKRLYEITVRHLLAHSAGWSLNYGDPAFNSLVIAEITKEKGPPTIDTYCKFIASRNLHFSPGSRSSYSNMGYMLLGRVIESATNQIYEDFVIQRVLKPYGIMDMHIGRSYLTQRRFNEVKYYDTDDSIKVQSFERTGRLVPKAYGGNPIELLGAAGGWITSSIELAKLMVLIDGFRNIPDMLPANLINQMIDDEQGRGPLGWKDVKDNGDWIRTGTMAGTTAIMKRQSNGFAWVVVLNSSSWKGPRLQAYINYMMGQIEKNVKKWPSLDLFKYQPKN